MKVYALVGWFGDLEWLEGVYAREEDADQACNDAWRDRRSTHVPDYVQGLCKFGVEEYEVIGSACKGCENARALGPTFFCSVHR